MERELKLKKYRVTFTLRRSGKRITALDLLEKLTERENEIVAAAGKLYRETYATQALEVSSIGKLIIAESDNASVLQALPLPAAPRSTPDGRYSVHKLPIEENKIRVFEVEN